MTATWGTPLVGLRTKKPDDYELVVGDRIIGEAQVRMPLYTSEGLILELLKTKYHHFEPHFDMKYASVRLEKVKVEHAGWWVWYHNAYIEVHLGVIKNPITWKLAAEAILGALSLIIAAYIVTVLYFTITYVGEKAGAAGIIGLIILAIVGLLVFAGVRFKG